MQLVSAPKHDVQADDTCGTAALGKIGLNDVLQQAEQLQVNGFLGTSRTIRSLKVNVTDPRVTCNTMFAARAGTRC